MWQKTEILLIWGLIETKMKLVWGDRSAITLAASGQVDEAIPYLKRAYQQDERWAGLVTRLPASGLLPEDQGLIDRLVRGMKVGQ